MASTGDWGSHGGARLSPRAPSTRLQRSQGSWARAQGHPQVKSASRVGATQDDAWPAMPVAFQGRQRGRTATFTKRVPDIILLNTHHSKQGRQCLSKTEGPGPRWRLDPGTFKLSDPWRQDSSEAHHHSHTPPADWPLPQAGVGALITAAPGVMRISGGGCSAAWLG